MRRPEPDADEPLLFDLPLETPERQHSPAPPAATERKRPAPPAPAARPPAPREEEPLLLDEAEDEEDLEPPAAPRRLGLGTRFSAGAADLLVHGAILIVLLIGTRLMGVRPALDDWPAFAVFLAAFSFLYLVVPLAFWGHTLGMAWAGLFSRNADGEPLTFDQTARRWLGAVLTTLLLGLPLLLTGPRRSLADRLSGSVTYLTGAA
jgi:uncharacterized RDD family membrane protein YckC